jgi:GWxTD domain-containing protein
LVEVDQLYIADLHSGSYQLQIEVTDHGNEDRVTRTVPFHIYKEMDFVNKSGSKVTSGSLDENPYAEVDEDALDREFKLCRYIATKEEKNRYGKLDLEEKRRFMNKFWKIRDKDLYTYENEFKRNYLDRVDYANGHFSYQEKEGWKTDRGRILLQYGMPDEIERFPSDIYAKAFQIWHYYRLEGGIRFYFVDVRGFGDLRLVHSTSRNEIRDPQWQRWLE